MFCHRSWYILGAGSIGLLWASYLKEAGQSCTLITRHKYFQSHRHVITRQTSNDKKDFFITRQSADHLHSPIHQLIIALKAFDAFDAVKSIVPLVAPHAYVLILSNGMKIQEKIASLLPERNIWVGSTSDGAWHTNNTVVHHAGKGVTWLGPMKKNTPFYSHFPQLSLNIRPCHDIRKKLWEKLAINSVINGLTAKYHCLNGELLKSPHIFSHVQELAKETERVLSLRSISLAQDTLSLSIDVLKKTAKNKSSTLQDILKGKKTELPWINGFLLEEAKKLQVQIPHHELLMQELKEKNMY